MKSNQSAASAATMLLFRILVACIPMLILLDAAAAQDKPPGYVRDLVLNGGRGVDTWWYDAGDGVNPNQQGCHIEVRGPNDWSPTGRVIEETCTREGLLVETTPGLNAIHKHEGDIGHPWLIDCNVWCQTKRIGYPNGTKRGRCQIVQYRPYTGKGNCKRSAACFCDLLGNGDYRQDVFYGRGRSDELPKLHMAPGH